MIRLRLQIVLFSSFLLAEFQCQESAKRLQSFALLYWLDKSSRTCCSEIATYMAVVLVSITAWRAKLFCARRESIVKSTSAYLHVHYQWVQLATLHVTIAWPAILAPHLLSLEMRDTDPSCSFFPQFVYEPGLSKHYNIVRYGTFIIRGTRTHG